MHRPSVSHTPTQTVAPTHKHTDRLSLSHTHTHTKCLLLPLCKHCLTSVGFTFTTPQTHTRGLLLSSLWVSLPTVCVIVKIEGPDTNTHTHWESSACEHCQSCQVYCS